jgi:hypothetical protein
MSDFLFILVGLTEYIVDFLCAPVDSRQPTRSAFPLILIANPQNRLLERFDSYSTAKEIRIKAGLSDDW